MASGADFISSAKRTPVTYRDLKLRSSKSERWQSSESTTIGGRRMVWECQHPMLSPASNDRICLISLVLRVSSSTREAGQDCWGRRVGGWAGAGQITCSAKSSALRLSLRSDARGDIMDDKMIVFRYLWVCRCCGGSKDSWCCPRYCWDIFGHPPQPHHCSRARRLI